MEQGDILCDVSSLIIGRQTELAVVDQAQEDAAAGNGRLVLISGEAGMGKSRLADAAVSRAARRGWTVARGNALNDPGAPPLWPWRRIVGDRPGAAFDTGAAAAAGGYADGERFRRFVDITGQLRDQAQGSGLLIVLEDLHWADRASLLLLRHVAGELDGSRLLVLATLRPTTAGPLPELIGLPVTRLIPLTGLDTAAVAAWLPHLMRGTIVDGLAELLRERTGGNPLFIRLVAEAMVEPSAAPADGSVIERLMSARPELSRLVSAKVDLLPRRARAVVHTASVLGDRIRVDVLSAVAGVDETAIHKAVQDGVAAGVLSEPADGDGAVFRHALVRDAVYARLAPARRAGLHRRAAEVLESAGRPLAGIIAEHWRRADGADATARCRQWARIADDEARAVLAYDEAARYAELAVTCARQAGEPAGLLAELLLRLAEARFAAGVIDDSLAACVEAAATAEQAGRPDLLAAAGLVIHGVGEPALNRALLRLCRRALAVIGPHEDVLRARLTAQVATAIAETEGGPDAQASSAVALRLAEATGNQEAVLEALAARHLSVCVPGTVAERLELGRRAVDLAGVSRQPLAALWGHLWRTDAAFQLGHLAAVDDELTEIDRVARVERSALARWHHDRLAAARAALVGEFPLARRHSLDAFRLGQRMQDFSLAGMHYAFCGLLAVVRGDPDELPSDILDLRRQAPPIPIVRISIPVQLALEGDLDAARAEFEQFRHLPASMSVGTRWAGLLSQIGVAAVLLDDVEVAETVYGLLAPFSHYYGGDGSGVVLCHGSNALRSGDLARVAGRADLALAHYRDAIAMNARIGALPFTALARLGLARTMHERTPPGSTMTAEDLKAAHDLLDRATSEFRRLDMPGPLMTATGLSATLAGLAAVVNPLSTREKEVAGLVAKALSNRQIAERLVLSERTVETHVRSILAKWGLSTRTEIAVRTLESARRP